MNIANIFGMYLGCMVEALFGPYSYKLYSVNREGGAYVDDLKTAERLYVNLENCKLLLTPLDKITEEDKREFEKVFRVRNLQEVSNIRCNGVYVLLTVNFDMGRDRSEVDATPCELLWLASKGYDIGICPKEYKEIVE